MPYQLPHSLYVVVAHSLPQGRCTQCHILWSHSNHSSGGGGSPHMGTGATLTLNMLAYVITLLQNKRESLMSGLIAVLGVGVPLGCRLHVVEEVHVRRHGQRGWPLLDCLVAVLL